MTPGDGLREGYVVSDRFQLLRVLGRGGMGSVWVARHLSLKIDVAIKFIDAALADRQDLRSRFAHEAQIAARIQSPHVVGILDYGFDRGRPYIAMELLQGEALRLRLGRRLPPDEVATIIAQAAKGLGRAHALGIIHRDLKPDNLFLCRDEDGGVRVKILDFGIARDDSPFGPSSHRTAIGEVLGTPAYMSPEQAIAKGPIDYRSDLYSLAVVAYHCLVGRLPFETNALGDLIVSLSTTMPPAPSSIAPDLHAGIDAWFRRAFEKNPAARFGSAKELADALTLACRSAPGAFDKTVAADEVRLPPAPTMDAWRPSPAPLMNETVARAPDTFIGQYATQDPVPRPAPKRGPHPVVLALSAVILIAAAAGGRLFVTRSHARGGGDAAAGSAMPQGDPAPSIAQSVAPPPAAPAPSASPSTSAPVGTVAQEAPAPTAPREPPPAPRRPSPPPRPTASTAAPRPAPTNDYGL
jgi:eukaryotic-like serine/threonine-protein kinase